MICNLNHIQINEPSGCETMLERSDDYPEDVWRCGTNMPILLEQLIQEGDFLSNDLVLHEKMPVTQEYSQIAPVQAAIHLIQYPDVVT